MHNPPTSLTTDTLASQTKLLFPNGKAVLHLTDWLEDDLMKSWNPPEPPLLQSPDRIQLQQLLDSKFARLQLLQKEADALWMEIVKNQVTLSPIRLLPPEILSRILCVAAKGNWDDVAFELHNRNVQWQTCSKSVIGVCKEWRSLAMFTPAFWSHINLSSIPVRSFRQILANSIQCPLHLLMPSYVNQGRREDTRSLIRDLSIALAPHRKRVKTFREAGNQSIFLWASSIPAGIVDNSWDNLQHLHLDPSSRSSSNALNILSDNIPSSLAFPQLLSLSIRHHPFHLLPRFMCPILKSFVLIDTVDSFEKLYQMVEYSPALIKLVVAMICIRDDEVTYPSRDLRERLRSTLANVKRLEVLKTHSIWPYPALWSCCPSLDTLVIYNGYRSSPPLLDSTLIHASVRTFILHTNVGLNSWSWYDSTDHDLTKLMDQYWHFWLTAFPALHRITVASPGGPDHDFEPYPEHPERDRYTTTTLLNSLTHTDGKSCAKPMLAPQLLEISFEMQDVDILPLFSFAKARLQDYTGRFDQKLTDSNLMPITLRLADCCVNTAPTPDYGWETPPRHYKRGARVDLTLTTFQDLDNAITITPYPVLGPDGWRFQHTLEDSDVVVEHRATCSEPEDI